MSTIKLRAGNYMVPVRAIEHQGRLFLHFPFNRTLMDEIKCMGGRAYHGYDGAHYRDFCKETFGTDKVWSIPLNQRNNFQLEYLKGGNPYRRYDSEIKTIVPTRPLMQHQIDLASHALSYHFVVWAAEMGLGKSLAAIEVMERSGFDDWWYVGPRSAFKSFERELAVWGSKVKPTMLTYERLVKMMKEWQPGQVAPHGVIVDESSRAKNPTAQRSQAVAALADGIRNDHGDDGFVVLMSGSPAPKSPSDWWHQAEVACPGFVREGSIESFQYRLGLFQDKAGSIGTFKQLITWFDDPRKCKVCGKLKHTHTAASAVIPGDTSPHTFVASENEVHKLYRRLSPLVMVKRQEDCLDLPEKIYQIIQCPVSGETMAAARIIASTVTRAASLLIQLRELSDGFQYQEVPDGKQKCAVCNGSRETPDYAKDPSGSVLMSCPTCEGTGEVPKFKRDLIQIGTPKDEAFVDLLDQHDEYERFVTYGAFTGTVDRCVHLAQAKKWNVIRADGRGWHFMDSEGEIVTEEKIRILAGDSGIKVHGDYRLAVFQDMLDYYGKICFIGQPDAAGMGITLTASPSILFYSNSFNAESRIQAEARIRRVTARGSNIFDLTHLPTDKLILDNLKMKRDLQNITLGEIQKFQNDGRLI